MKVLFRHRDARCPHHGLQLSAEGSHRSVEVRRRKAVPFRQVIAPEEDSLRHWDHLQLKHFRRFGHLRKDSESFFRNFSVVQKHAKTDNHRAAGHFAAAPSFLLGNFLKKTERKRKNCHQTKNKENRHDNPLFQVRGASRHHGATDRIRGVPHGHDRQLRRLQ
jgi:hypothetical protein